MFMMDVPLIAIMRDLATHMFWLNLTVYVSHLFSLSRHKKKKL